MEITIKLPETYDVVAHKVISTVDVTKLDENVIASAALHGIKQKIADAASGATRYAEENEMEKTEAASMLMDKAVNKLIAEGWSASRTPANPLAKYIRAIVRQLLQSDATLKAEHDALPDAKAKNAWLDEKAAASKSADAINAKAQEMADAEARAKAEAKKAIANLEI